MNEKQFARDLAAVLALLRKQGKPIGTADLIRRPAPKQQRRDRKPKA